MMTLSDADASREAAFLNTVYTLARRRAQQLLVIEDCDDLARDVVLDVLTGLRNGRMDMTTAGLSSLVGVIVIRRLRNAFRSGERRRHREDVFGHRLEAIGHEWMPVDGPREDRGQWEALEAAKRALPPTVRRIWELLQVPGSTYRTVALELAVSHASVNRYVVMARRELTTALQAYKASCSPDLDAWPTGDAVQEGEVVGRVGKVVKGRGEAAA